jgi:HD-GYP domain-containing protein (c-di-GMP phosphodiesterase class II)
MPDAEATAPQDAPILVIEARILDRLTDWEDQHPWSVEELTRALGYRLTVEAALRNLDSLGLIHRCDDLIFPTRAALHSPQLKR